MTGPTRSTDVKYLQKQQENLWRLADRYGDTMTCPYCHNQTVELIEDDELEQDVNKWRAQCQTCGLQTPELEDLEQVLNIWEKFGSVFTTEMPF